MINDKRIYVRYTSILQRLGGPAIIIAFFAFCSINARAPLLPLRVHEIGGHPNQVGIASACINVIAGFTSIITGYASDVFGRRLIITLSLLLLSLSMLLVSNATTCNEIYIACLVAGAGSAGFSPSMMAYVVERSILHSHSKSLGLYTGTVFLAFTVSPIIVGFLAETISVRSTFLISALILLFLAFLSFFVVQASNIREVRGRLRNKLNLFRFNKGFVLSNISNFFNSLGFSFFIAFFPVLAASQMKTVEIGFTFAIQSVSNSLSRPLFGYLNDKFVDRPTLTIVGIILLSLGIWRISISTSSISFWFMASVIGIGGGFSYTGITSMLYSSVDRAETGFALGAFHSVSYFGFMVGALTAGMLTTHLGISKAFFIGALISVIAVIPLIGLPSETRSNISNC